MHAVANGQLQAPAKQFFDFAELRQALRRLKSGEGSGKWISLLPEPTVAFLSQRQVRERGHAWERTPSAIVSPPLRQTRSAASQSRTKSAPTDAGRSGDLH
ncbi:MAG: hypothetical protein QM805_01915 [Pseudomonas sp.]